MWNQRPLLKQAKETDGGIESLQIFTQEAVAKVTNIPASALAMIFTPALFRPSPTVPADSTVGKGPAVSGPAVTNKAIATLFDYARQEQKFVHQLLTYLDVNRLEDENDWLPSHGRTESLASSKYSTACSASIASKDVLNIAIASQADSVAGPVDVLPRSMTSASAAEEAKELKISSSASAPVIQPRSSPDPSFKRPAFERTTSASSASSDGNGTSGESGFSIDSRSLGSTRRRHKDRPRTRQPTAPAASAVHPTAVSRRHRTRTELPHESSISSSHSSDSDDSAASTGAETTPEVPESSRMRHLSESTKAENKWPRAQTGFVPAVPKLVKPRIVVDEAD